uniref:tRNA/rRNA methyltransferase SpoU type domain-containing protein n=1 Tax=Glossina brevipalpis TaxID=37001 RepID=A0A1A9W2T6_9MUSC
MGSAESVESNPLTIERLFAFLQEHFHEYREPDNLSLLPPLIDRYLQRNERNMQTTIESDESSIDIGGHLLQLFAQYEDNEDDLKVVLQIAYQVLYTITELDNHVYKINEEVIRFLINMLPTIHSKQLITKTVIYMQLYLKRFDTEYVLLREIWDIIKQRASTSMVLINNDFDVLVQMIDLLKACDHNIFNEPYFLATTKYLLNSDDGFERKYGLHLLRKSVHWLTNHVAVTWMRELNQNVETSWLVYITLLENLEEDQSHLILPSLNYLNELRNSEAIQGDWLTILYSRVLKHNNTLVKRWTIEYFMSELTSNDLNENILKQVLELSNSNFFYNHENYFLPRQHFDHFLSKRSSLLYTLLGDINWKPVPLYMWLKCLDDQSKNNLPKPSFESLLQIASKVRALRNYNIRQKVITLMNKCFANEIQEMSLIEYINFIESLYNPADIFKQHDLLFGKPLYAHFWETETYFSERLLEILYSNVKELEKASSSLLKFLKCIPKQNQGFLRFSAFYIKGANKYAHIFSELYNLNRKLLHVANLPSIINNFDEALVWDYGDQQQGIQARNAAIIYYLNHYPDKACNELDNISTIVLASDIPACTLSAFSSLINHAYEVNISIIDELIYRLEKIKCKEFIEIISWNICNQLDKSNYSEIYIENLMKYPSVCAMYCYSEPNFLKWFDTKLLLSGNFINGEPRFIPKIEAVFQYHEFSERPDGTVLGFLWLNALSAHGDKSHINHLLNCHKECTKKKPRYFENSREHRSKFRIACGVYILYEKIRNDNEILDEIWNILLNENNQSDVTLIYEHIVGYFENRFAVLLAYLKEMPNLTASQQITIAVITNHFCLRDELLKLEELKAIIQHLLPFIMGPNFQTRLYCQLVLWNIMEKYDKIFCSDIQVHTLMQQLMQAIKLAANGKLDEHLKDIRLIPFQKATKNGFHFLKVIMYITNVPFDELHIDSEMDDLINDKLLNQCKENFLKKYNKKSEHESDIELEDKGFDISNFIQRKMNPVNNFVEQTDLITYPKEENSRSNMYVVASLIEKLPNLGGIARTCEVLGVHNLILSSKMHIEKADFKNLRKNITYDYVGARLNQYAVRFQDHMTAERTLNIIEVPVKDLKLFLVRKQMEGYKIVGAEQTCNSECFETFEFPQKCILLLGHEKNGVPASLLGLLDYIVEIPQFGNVRSLNVHVTAALFMWEYCKQHILS